MPCTCCSQTFRRLYSKPLSRSKPREATVVASLISLSRIIRSTSDSAKSRVTRSCSSRLQVRVAAPQTGGEENVKGPDSSSRRPRRGARHKSSARLRDPSPLVIRPAPFPAARLPLPVPRSPGVAPNTAFHRVAVLLHKMAATVIIDRNDHHEIRLLDETINPTGAVWKTDRVLAHTHPSVFVDQPSAGSLDIYRVVVCDLTMSLLRNGLIKQQYPRKN